MNRAGGYADYAFIADLYDHVAPYRDRADVPFYVAAAQESGGPVLEVGSRCGFEVEQVYADNDRSPYGSKYPGELIFVARKGEE